MYHYTIWDCVKDSIWPQENQGIWVRKGCVSRKDHWKPHVCPWYYLPQSGCGHTIFITQQNTPSLVTVCVCVRIVWVNQLMGGVSLPCRKCFQVSPPCNDPCKHRVRLRGPVYWERRPLDFICAVLCSLFYNLELLNPGSGDVFTGLSV